MMKRFWMGLMTVLLAIAVTITINYAWFVNSYDVNPLADGSSVDAYYYTGSGTKLDPYVITTPRHLYNLAWLQYLGKYNKDAKSGTAFPATYFRLGMEANKTLDMTGWPLPPIGTTKYPFIGNFDGNGWTITGLNTTNTWSEFGAKHPSSVTESNFEKANCSVIGFFGSIGAFNGTVISDGDTTNGCSYDTTNNKVYDFYLNDNNVHTSHSTTLIGAVAGYVNATIEDVGVIQPHLNIQASGVESSLDGKTTNLSDFAVVGYAEAKYTTQKTKKSTIIYNPTYNYSHFNFKGMGSQADWGGSINFANTYQRIKDIVKGTTSNTNKYTSAASISGYVGSEIQYYKEVDGLNVIDTDRTNLSVDATSFVNFATNATTAVKYYNYGNENGSYLRTCNSDDSDQFMTLTALYKDVIIVTKKEGTENGYKIKDSSTNNYLDIESSRNGNTLNFNVSIDNESNNQRVWVYSGNKLYAYNEDDGKKYYLNATTTSLSVSTTASTNWTYDSANNAFYFTSGIKYYLRYYRGAWCITPLYVIKDGNNYLKMNSTTDNQRVTNATTEANATVWEFSTNGTNPSGTIKTISGATTRYLRLYNGNLVTSSSSTNWSNSGSGLYNGSNYIQFRNGYWVAMTNPAYKIGYSTNYLKKDGTNTNSDDAALWTFGGTLATSGGSGTASMLLNGTTQYLTNNNGNLTVSTTATTWYNDGGNLLYSTANNQMYYLIYDNGWKLDVMDYYIKDSGSNYLAFNDSTSIKNATSATTLWHFSNAGGTYPIGSMSCINGGTTYYLNKNGNNLVLSTNSNTTWANDGDGLYCTDNSVKYYLVYDGTWKIVSYTYKIKSGTDYLSLDGNNIIRTDEASATEWTFSNSGVNPSGTISSNGRYLYIDGNGILATTTAGNALSFNNSGSGLYDSNNNYIQYYNQKWVCGKAFYIKYGDTYMSYNLGTTSNWKWFYYSNANDPQGVIYTVNNGTVYYLHSNNGTLTCNANSTTNWLRDTNGLYVDYNGNKYIQYDSGWKLAAVSASGYKISYNGTYLNASGHSLVGGTDSTSASIWTVDNNNYLYTIVNGDTYVLYSNRSDIPEIDTTISSSNYGYGIKNDRIIRQGNYSWDLKYDGTQWKFFSGTTDYLDWETVMIGNIATTTNVTNDSISTITSTSTNRSTYVSEVYNILSIDSINKTALVVNASSNFSISTGSAIVYKNSGTDYTGTNALPSVYSAIPITTKGDKLQNTPSDYSTGQNYVVDDSNTGYIISGGHEPRKAADLRISYWQQNGHPPGYNNQWYSNMPQGALLGGSYSSGSFTNIYTITQSGNSYAPKQITETTVNGIKQNDCGFTKYFASKDTLERTLSSSSNLYAAHFMNAPISKTKYIIMPKVTINGNSKTNFQMPEDCIDFTLKSKGTINFFSSYFYYNTDDGGANNCFFSLNEIIRDSNYNISQIRHILKVYEKNSDGTYVYYFQDADDSSVTGYYTKNKDGDIIPIDSFVSSDYTMKFDSDWIEDPAKSKAASSNRQNFYGTRGANYGTKVFYFEIPANIGEYALGSVSKTDYSGKPYNGAYIMYLDIGANASVVDRTAITEQMDETTKDLTYVNGIQVLAETNNNVYSFVSAEDSAVAIIASQATGVIDIERTGNSITFSRSLNSTYWGDQITVTNGSLTVPTSSKTTKVLKYLDFNNGTNSLYYTTVWDIDGTRTYQVQLMDGEDNPIIATHNSTTEQIQAAEYGLLKIGTGDDAGYGIAATAQEAISANTFSTSTTILDYYFYIATANKGDASVSYDMSVDQITGSESTYTFTDGYTSTHCYKLISNDITLAPNGLLVYIGPTLKASAGITGPASNVATVTVTVSDTTYTFTFNASAINNTAKTVTIYYVSS